MVWLFGRMGWTGAPHTCRPPFPSYPYSFFPLSLLRLNEMTFLIPSPLFLLKSSACLHNGMHGDAPTSTPPAYPLSIHPPFTNTPTPHGVVPWATPAAPSQPAAQNPRQNSPGLFLLLLRQVRTLKRTCARKDDLLVRHMPDLCLVAGQQRPRRQGQ